MKQVVQLVNKKTHNSVFFYCKKGPKMIILCYKVNKNKCIRRVYNMKKFRITSFIFLILGMFLLNIPFVVAQENIEIKNISVLEQSSTMTIDEINIENNIITSNVSFNEVNDFVTLSVDINNNTNIDYIYEKINNSINNDYLKVESESIGKTIKGNSTETIIIKIIYDKELQNHDDILLNNVSLGLVFKDPTVLVNPLTGINLFILIAVILTIIILSFYAIKNKKYKSLLLLLFLIPFCVQAEERLNVSIGFSNLTIKGRYLQYRVQVNDGIDTVIDTEITYGDSIGSLPLVPPKTGYNDGGWVDQNNNEINEESIVVDDLIVSPLYIPIDYSITYILNGGTVKGTNPSTYNIEDEITLINPSKTGYNFAGWIEDGDGTLKTNLTIYPGTIGDKVFIATYTSSDNTNYIVKHRMMDINGVYKAPIIETYQGTTGSTITPQPKQITGFITPPAQTITIKADGSSVVVYDYVREKYQFNITDRTYLSNDSTPNGEYYYETPITLKATNRPGYSFSWSDGDTNLERTFELGSTLTLTPNYTPNTNTPYRVVHKLMNMDGRTYTIRDDVTYTGTTDSHIEPDTNIYEGFTAPQKQNVTINGDGTTVVEYKYTRNKYNLVLEDSNYIETTTPSGKYYYGTEITLKAKDVEDWTFVKWSNDNINQEITFTLREDTTLKPIYNKSNLLVTFVYNGGSGEEIIREIEPDHEIGTLPETTRTGYYLDGWFTLMEGGDKVTSSYVPTTHINIYAHWKKSVEAMEIDETSIVLEVAQEKNIVISNKSQIEETYTFTSSDESIATVDQNGKITGIAVGEATITITGTKSNKTQIISVEVLSNQYAVTFYGNGGTPDTQTVSVIKGEPLSVLPTASRENYYLDGWFTLMEGGDEITSSYVPTSNKNVYAHWKKSVEAMQFTETSIVLEENEQKNISILNAAEIEEEYTFTSNNEAIAEVTQTGRITGKADGNTTITITGTKSHKIKTINVTVTGNYAITYNANGGKFTNNLETKTITYDKNITTKYSHTSNVDDNGYKSSSYGNSWTNADITGTDRGDTTGAHVVTIPNATSLVIDIFYNGESISYDWVSIWAGSHSTYTAASNSSSAITGAQKLGGVQTGTYIVNGNTLSNMGYSRFIVSGNTVTFGFKTDTSGAGAGYGYYAIVTGVVASSSYETPTRDGMTFLNWYNNANCSSDQLFLFNQINESRTVYASWGYTVTYNVNGGTSISNNSRIIPQETALGTLPTTTRTGYYFDGWYTLQDGGEKVTASYVPTSNITLYARWKKSVGSMTFASTTLELGRTEEAQINITNASSIEETYTFTSNKTSVATVDSTGKVTGVGVGTATITIRGTISNHTKTITVNVIEKTVITYNANGGSFSNNTTINRISKSYSAPSYSYTANVSSTGVKNSNYTDNQDNSYIRGTGRSSGSTNAHVITISNATKLIIDIYYNGESVSYDWVSIWAGSHSSYTAASNSTSAITGAQKLGGVQSGTYTVNGNTLTSMGHSTFEVSGDSVTFGFKSDISQCGAGYGYYAIIRGFYQTGTYLEPTKSNGNFLGWYKDAACTSGQEYDNSQTESITVYACWGHTVTYNSNGGTSVSPTTKKVLVDESIGTLPTPTRTGYYLEGWSTLQDGGEIVTPSYVPTSNITLYARWKKSVESIVQNPPELSLEVNEEQTIEITNQAEIQESYTFESLDSSIATVDQTGKIKGISQGNTTIVIRGTTSNQTKNISVTVSAGYTVTYNANGGKYSNNETTNEVTYGKEMIKYSHTANIDDLGKKLESYGNNWTNANITGTDRGDTSKAHVVTIPNATSLKVDIYYSGESTSYDWASIWEGNHPDYTAANNSSSAITNGQKLGGSQSSSYTVNGNTISNVYKRTFTIDGDTVTFGFKSNASGVGSGYGYYAIIKGKALDGEYKEPTKADKVFYNWYTDSSCTTLFDNTQQTTNTTVYAAWANTITYDVTGGSNLTSPTVIVKENSTIGTLPTTSKTGYYFTGWYTEQTGGDKVTTSYTPTTNKTLYAHWIKTVSSMEFSSTSLTTTVGHTVQIEITNASEIEEEYTFTSSNTSVATVSSTGLVTGVTQGSTTITIKGTTSNQTKTISVTVAEFSKYDITLNSNGGDVNETINYITFVPIGSLPVPKKNNYKFLGWYTNDGQLIEADYYPNGNMTLYARWSENKEFTVSFDSNDGNEIENIVVNENEVIETLPIPQKDEYHFEGWYTGLTNGIKVNNGYEPTSDILLYARWSAATTYTITFDPNSGSVSTTTRSAYSDTPIGELPIPTRSGYSFIGWLDETNNVYYSPTTIPTGNITLKAQWNTTNYVARINNTYYTSISNAISNAIENDTITLIKNTSETPSNSKKITLDLNGYKLTGNITNSGELLLKNGTIEGNSSTTTLISNTGKLILGTSKYNQNDKVTLKLSSSASTTKYGISGVGEVIINNSDITISSSSNSVYGISAHNVTLNSGNIKITNTSASSSYYTSAIVPANTNSNITVNGGLIEVTSSAKGSYGINMTQENSYVTINGGIIRSRLNSSSSLATGVNISTNYSTVVVNGGSIYTSAPNFRPISIYAESTNYNKILVTGGYISYSEGKAETGGVFIADWGTNDNIIVTGGHFDANYYNASSYTRGFSIDKASTNLYIYDCEMTLQPATNTTTVYPIYISSSGNVYYYGGTFKMKSSNSTYTNKTSNVKLPSGKQVVSSTDSNGYKVFSLGNS